MAEIFRLYTLDTLGKDVDPRNPIKYVKPQPQYFMWVEQEIWVKSTETWEHLRCFIPCVKAVDDVVVGAVIPTSSGFKTYLGKDYDNIQADARRFAQYRNRVTNRPIVEEIEVVREIVNEIRVPYTPWRLVVPVTLAALVSILGNIIW